MAFADDVLAMLGGPFGVPVVFGAARTTGILDVTTREGTDAEGYTVTLRESVLMVPQAWVDGLTGVATDAALTIDGVAYVVRNVQAEDDQQVARVIVARAG